MTITVNIAGSTEISKNVRLLVAGHESAALARFSLTAPDVLFAAVNVPTVPLALSGAKYVTITSEDDLRALKVALEGTPEEREEKFGFPVKTLIIDSLDELQRIMLVARMAREKRMETVSEDWTWISNRLNRIYTGLNGLDLNIISLTHLAQVHESTAIKPNIQGAFVTQVHKYVDYALLLDSFEEVAEPEEVVVKSSTEEEVVVLEYPTKVTKTLITAPTQIASWIHDDTGTLPRFIDLTFEDDFATIVAYRETLVAPESDSVVVDPEPLLDLTDGQLTDFTGAIPETPVDDIKPDEPAEEAEPAPGMSSISDIKAKLLNKA